MAENQIVWSPSKELIEKSNVKRFMDKHGIKDYKELVERSIQDIEWFWDAVVKDLNIEWFKPYEKVLDTSRGIQWAKWFLGGKINVAHNCLDRHAKSHRRNKVACIFEGEDGSVRKLTYWNLYVETNKVANALKAIGIKKGDAVGIYMPMVPEIIVAAFACAKIGAIFIPIFSGYGPEAVASRLSDCEAKALFTADGFFRRGSKVNMKDCVDSAVEKCPTIKNVIVFKRLGIDIPWKKGRDLWWDDFISGQSRECKTEWIDSEDPLFIAYTSGTTGRPKGAVHVHGGFLVKIAEEVAYPCDLKDEDILFWVTDMGWIMGPWEIVGAGALGGTILFYEGAPDYPSPDRLWSIVEKHGVTILGVSPTLVRALIRRGDEWVKKHDLSTLRIIGSTGEPWDPESWTWYFKNVGGGRCPVINISGGTEVVCFLQPLPIAPLKPCTLQGPALGMDIDVFDENGKPVRGVDGELVAKKPWPSMTRGLWKDPERFIETYWSRWPNVWVHGDWAYVDEDGFWFLHGRSDDVLKIAGKRVGPAEIESALTPHPAVSEAAAIGVPHEIKGEEAMCFVVLKPGYAPTDELREELKSQVANLLGKPLKPGDVKFVKDLPKTRSAKILRRLIKLRFLGKELPKDLSSVMNPEALEEISKAV